MHSASSSSLEPNPLNVNYKLEFHNSDKEVVASLYQDGKIKYKYTFTDLTPTQDWTYGTLPHLARSKFDEFLTSRGIQVPLKRKRHVRAFVTVPPPTAKTVRSLFSQSPLGINTSNPSDNLEDPSSSMSSSSSHSSYYQQQTQIAPGDAALFQSVAGAPLLDGEVVVSFHDRLEDWKQACDEK